MKHYIQRNWKFIKRNSYKGRTGYNPDFIQGMIFDEMNILIELEIIKNIIKEIRYIVKLHR